MYQYLLLMAEKYPLYRCSFVYSSDGYLGCFYFLAIKDSAAVNIHVDIIEFSVFSSFEWISGSYGIFYV